MKRDVRLLLDSIRSVHNVGSIFRTAETVGVRKIYCAGTTPTPVDRFNRKRPDLAKVALGAEDMVEWEHVVESMPVANALKKDGFQVVALEQTEGSVDYKSITTSDRCLIILGAEVDGVSKDLLRLADVIAEIPMHGQKESLNVSVSAGIFLFRLFDR